MKYNAIKEVYGWKLYMQEKHNIETGEPGGVSFPVFSKPQVATYVGEDTDLEYLLYPDFKTVTRVYIPISQGYIRGYHVDELCKMLLLENDQVDFKLYNQQLCVLLPENLTI